jgi:hypothetical protein
VIDLHCHNKFRENFYIFEALWLHFWRFLKQIRKQIGCKLAVFYKNGYHFTKIITLLHKFLPKNVKLLTWILPDFCLSFTVGVVYTPTPPGRYVPVDTLTLTVKQTIRNLFRYIIVSCFNSRRRQSHWKAWKCGWSKWPVR